MEAFKAIAEHARNEFLGTINHWKVFGKASMLPWAQSLGF